MYVSTGKLLQATVLLALAITGTLAAKCDFKLSQTGVGNMARLEVGTSVAMSNSGTENGVWRGFVKNGNNLTVSDFEGASVSYNFANMSDTEQNGINYMINIALPGVTVTGQQGGSIAINPNFNNVNVATTRGAYRFGDNSHYATVYYAGARGFNFAHIIYQNNSAVFLVDEECETVELKSLHEVDRQLQSFLKDVMDDEQ